MQLSWVLQTPENAQNMLYRIKKDGGIFKYPMRLKGEIRYHFAKPYSKSCNTHTRWHRFKCNFYREGRVVGREKEIEQGHKKINGNKDQRPRGLSLAFIKEGSLFVKGVS